MNHTKPFALLITMTLAGSNQACVQEQESGDVISDVLPTAKNIRVNLPEEVSAAKGNEGKEIGYAVGDVADYYRLTRGVTRGFNAGAAFVLVLVHTIVQFPPTEVSGATYTWGPHSDALDPAEWKLIVVDNLDDSYDWHFEGRSKIETNAQWETTVSGNAVAGTTPNRGNGSFFLDFDAAERVNPLDNDASGTVEVVYDLENRDGTQATVAMHIENQEPDENGDLQPVEADYFYGESSDGSGDFQFTMFADLDDDDGAAFENLDIRSRWAADGAGRADARVANGDLGEGVSVTVSECWNTQFRRVFYSDSFDWIPSEGNMTDCVFSDQLLPASN